VRPEILPSNGESDYQFCTAVTPSIQSNDLSLTSNWNNQA